MEEFSIGLNLQSGIEVFWLGAAITQIYGGQTQRIANLRAKFRLGG